MYNEGNNKQGVLLEQHLAGDTDFSILPQLLLSQLRLSRAVDRGFIDTAVGLQRKKNADASYETQGNSLKVCESFLA